MKTSKLIIIVKFFSISAIVVTLWLSFFIETSFAHPGNTDSAGCHTCYTNCTDWGLSYYEYHCHTPKYQAPPICPIFSSYSYSSGQCECYSGYVASGSICISNDQACKNQYGYGSATDYAGRCKCNYGYVWNDSGTSCVSTTSYCSGKYGYLSTYNTLSNSCECMSGYTFNKSGTSCISKDQACRDLNGLMSKHDILTNRCVCLSGYVYNGSQCVYESVTPVYLDNQNYNPPTPTVKPTQKPKVQIQKSTPTPIPTGNVTSSPTTLVNQHNHVSWTNVFQEILKFLKGLL